MRVLCSLFAFSLFACVSDKAPTPRVPQEGIPQTRPFRLGFLKLSPNLDQQKPLAPADYVGWIEDSGLIFGSHEPKKISAISIDSHAKVWSRNLKSDLTVPILKVGEYLIAADRNGTVSKFETKTGKLVWEKDLPSFAVTALQKDNERIFLSTAHQTLYALNAKTGQIEWIYDPEVSLDMHIQNTAPPFVYGANIYWGLTNGEVLAIEGNTGKELWRVHPEPTRHGRFHNYMGSLFVSFKQLVFCRFDGLIGGISLKNTPSGELSWSAKDHTGSCIDSDFRSGVFYAATSTGDFVAVDIQTGKNRWKALKLGKNLSTISAVEDYIIATGVDGEIYALNPRGQLVWFDQINARILSKPFFVGPKLYVTTGLKNVYAYRL